MMLVSIACLVMVMAVVTFEVAVINGSMGHLKYYVTCVDGVLSFVIDRYVFGLHLPFSSFVVVSNGVVTISGFWVDNNGFGVKYK